MPPKARAPAKGKGSGKGKAASGQGEPIPTSCTYGKNKFTADAKKLAAQRAAQAAEDAEKKKGEIPIYSVHETDFFGVSHSQTDCSSIGERGD
jgi:hypothetical protein